FGVRILDEAVTEAVRLSHRYISGRQLPDKAVSVLDTACAKVALGQGATPAAIEDADKHLQRLEQEIAAVSRDEQAGASHGDRLADLQSERAETQDRIATLRERLDQEVALVQSIQRLRDGRGETAVPGQADSGHSIPELLSRLREVQGDAPMVPLQADGSVVAEIVSNWTGIPLGRMVKDEIATISNLSALLAERVTGQQH